MSVNALLGAAAAMLLTTAVQTSQQVLTANQATPGSCLKTCAVTDALVNLIAQFEGYSPFAYKDAGGKATIGFGHLIKPGENIPEPLLPPDAAKLLGTDLVAPSGSVNKDVQRPLQQNQFNALVSFTFNVGTGNFKKSTLLKKVNAHDDNGVPAQFLRWDTVGGKEVSGLAIRRRTEANLYAATVGSK